MPGGAEAELAPNAVIERREWLEITLSCIGEGVIAADRKGRVNYLNPVAEKLTGWPLADAAGEEIEKVFRSVHETTRKPLREPVGKVIERGMTVALEDNALLIARDGTERPIAGCAAAIKDDRGTVVGVVLAFRDITDRKRIERALKEVERQKDEINAQLAVAHARMSRDLKAAAKIQETFLPRELANFTGAAFAWIYRPCDELAGDGLNIVPLGDGKVGLYILDVSGHGVASALLAMALSRVLSSPSEPSSILTRDGSVPERSAIIPPAEIADRLNQLFPYTARTEQFATMIYGVLDAMTGEFRYVSAGHPGPVHLPAGAGPVILASPGFPIGLAEDAYEERCVRLAPGDRLYLYSDGVTEMMDPTGVLFGDGRLLEAIGRGRSVGLQESVAAVLGEVERWRGTASVQDDISIVAVEVSRVVNAERIASCC